MDSNSFVGPTAFYNPNSSSDTLKLCTVTTKTDVHPGRIFRGRSGPDRVGWHISGQRRSMTPGSRPNLPRAEYNSKLGDQVNLTSSRLSSCT